MKLNRILALALALFMLLGCTALAETTFPIVTEHTTLHVMAQVGSYYPDQKLDNVHGLQKYEQLSGVHIEWDNVNNSVFSEQLSARIGDTDTKLPDVILRGKITIKRLIRNIKKHIWPMRIFTALSIIAKKIKETSQIGQNLSYLASILFV